MTLDSLLQKFCPPDEIEHLRGDLEELFNKRVEQFGWTRARYHYARDLLSICRRGLMKQLEEGQTMNFHLNYSPKLLAVIGLVGLCLPGFFLLAVLLEEGFGIGLLFDPLARFTARPENLRIFNITSPILFLGGCLVAFLVNILSVCSLSVRLEQKALVSTFRLEPKLLNLLIVAVSTLFVTIFLGYAFVENFRIVETHM